MKLQENFELQVDPDNELLPAERAKRAESARKAYFALPTHARLIRTTDTSGKPRAFIQQRVRKGNRRQRPAPDGGNGTQIFSPDPFRPNVISRRRSDRGS